MSALATASELVGMAAGGLAVGGVVLAAARRWLRRELREIQANTRQLRTNGGSHVADAINRIEAAVDRLDGKLDDTREHLAGLAGEFAEHVRATRSDHPVPAMIVAPARR